EDPGEVLDDLGVARHCCRRMLVSHRDLVDVVSPYQ
ncbi:DNA-directed RNA polymerase subunit N, partial [Halorubrum sp. E3]